MIIIITTQISGCTSLEKDIIILNSFSQQLNNKNSIIIVVDVFRAFTTACYILEQHPNTYIITNKSSVIAKLSKNFSNPLLIGKPEKNSNLVYSLYNSPTRISEINIQGRNILHRTDAGASGILNSSKAALVLVTSFVNASATAKYVRSLKSKKIIILAMGHLGITPSLEDIACAIYIKALLQGKKMNLKPYEQILKAGSGKYFFSTDQWQYPETDFYLCLELNKFNFVIKAEILDQYAILTLIK